MSDNSAIEPESPPELGELEDLIRRAQEGDPSAPPRLRAILDARPALWGWYGDPAGHVREAWIAQIGGPDPIRAEALRHKLEALRSELIRPGAVSIERLLAERVTATWLQLAHADLAAASAGALSMPQAALAMQRQAWAERRHRMALATLATAQRLLPAVGDPASVDLVVTADPDVEAAGPDGLRLLDQSMDEGRCEDLHRMTIVLPASGRARGRVAMAAGAVPDRSAS